MYKGEGEREGRRANATNQGEKERRTKGASRREKGEGKEGKESKQSKANNKIAQTYMELCMWYK